MSKIVIFLFATSVASAVHASNLLDKPKSLQNRLESNFATKVAKVGDEYNSGKSLLNENSGDIYTRQNLEVLPIFEDFSDAFINSQNKAVDASKLLDELKSLQNRLESYFATSIAEVEEKYNITKSLVNKNSLITSNERAVIISENATTFLDEVIEKYVKEIHALIQQTEPSRSTKHCEGIFTHLRKMSEDYTEAFLACLQLLKDEVIVSFNHVEGYYQNFHSTINFYRNRIAPCLRTVTNTEEVNAAISCMTTIKHEMESWTTQYIPLTVGSMDKTNRIITERRKSLQSCLRGDYFQKLINIKVNEAKKCYQLIIQGARTGCNSHAKKA